MQTASNQPGVGQARFELYNLLVIIKRSFPNGSENLKSRKIGYARISTREQDMGMQVDALRAAGCEEIVEETATGKGAYRPALEKALKQLVPGDTLIVWKLDRIGRSLSHLLQTIEAVREKGAHFSCLTSPIDTGSPVGNLVIQILGSVAEFERTLIVERTNAGLAAARLRGRVGGNPRLKNRDKLAIRDLSFRRKDAFNDEVLRGMKFWRKLVIECRPDKSWVEIVGLLNRVPGREKWTPKRLVRHVKAAVRSGLVPVEVLERAPALKRNVSFSEVPTAMRIAVVCVRRDQNCTLSSIAGEIAAAKIPSRQGLPVWPISSVANLVKRARAMKLV